MPNRAVVTAFVRLLGLQDDPRPRQAIKLRGAPRWRLRFGEHRIIYSVSDREQVVIVLEVVRRSESTYK
ncbi:MAG: type II toxin-antitoxin system RelE/ParE family toxin [Chloroflexi bacterium]|nr:type II toxin-antitoxin system RelE/ParE family toxin [Chloroflexota bacterium]